MRNKINWKQKSSSDFHENVFDVTKFAFKNKNSDPNDEMIIKCYYVTLAYKIAHTPTNTDKRVFIYIIFSSPIKMDRLCLFTRHFFTPKIPYHDERRKSFISKVKSCSIWFKMSPYLNTTMQYPFSLAILFVVFHSASCGFAIHPKPTLIF